jgi:Neuraminidase (sialidase)
MAADDFPLGGRLCAVRSSDEGRTWSKPELVYDDADDNRDPHVAQLDDGTVVVTFFSWRYKPGVARLKSFRDYTSKWFRANAELTGVQMITSRDGGKTWDAKARNVFPDWVCSAPVRQLKDGTCILGLYGKNKQDGKHSVGASARSTDRGKTWETPVAMENPPGVSLDAETDIIELKDGRLLAALRQSKGNMYFATSSDAGRSWSPAKDAGFPGHCPHFTRLTSGEILLSTRIPQTELRISRDEAKTWQGPFEIDQVFGAYPATVELKDKSVLIVYYTEGRDSHVRARRFKLTGTGIEFLPLEK